MACRSLITLVRRVQHGQAFLLLAQSPCGFCLQGMYAMLPCTAEHAVPLLPAVPAALALLAGPILPAVHALPAEPALPAGPGLPVAPALPAGPALPADPVLPVALCLLGLLCMLGVLCLLRRFLKRRLCNTPASLKHVPSCACFALQPHSMCHARFDLVTCNDQHVLRTWSPLTRICKSEKIIS